MGKLRGRRYTNRHGSIAIDRPLLLLGDKMRSSGTNGRTGERTDRKLEGAISELLAECAGTGGARAVAREYGKAVREIAEATREIAAAYVVAAECAKLGRRKRYEARYYVDRDGVNGNLVRSWDVAEAEGEGEGADASLPLRKMAFLPLAPPLGSYLYPRFGMHSCSE